jgi:hypothetical protein
VQFLELLSFLAAALERLGLRYIVTGSTAIIVYGEPRFTNDIDVVVDLPLEKVAAFCEAFPPEQFYLSLAAVTEAVQSRHQFNILYPSTAANVDVIVASDSEFDRSRLARARSLIVLPDRDVFFASPEDVILKKMVYYQIGGSDKHLGDIASVLRVQGIHLDRDYIELWSSRMGVLEIWRLVLDRERPA